MKKIITVFVFLFCFALNAQNSPKKSSKQYRSAETGRYVTKKQADKSPKTTYSTTRKKSSKKS
jgi:hypothetical protein